MQIITHSVGRLILEYTVNPGYATGGNTLKLALMGDRDFEIY